MMDWYCIHTKPAKEVAADRYLREMLGLETYYPQLKEQRTIRYVKRWVTGALFPRYLFCRFELAEHYRAVRYAPQVNDVVSFGERPTVVDTAILEQLQAWAGEAVDTVTLRPVLLPGALVEIMNGPLCGLEAVFQQELSDQERVVVLLNTLACRPRVVLNRSQIALVA